MRHIDERRAAAVRLAEALRELNAAAVVTEVPSDVLDRAARAASELAARLTAAVRSEGALASIDDLATGTRMYTPAAGPASPLSPPIRFDSGDSVVTGRVTLGPGYEGHVGYAHGGIIALLLDEALGTAASRRVWPSVTGRLVICYRRPVPVGVPLLVRASIAAVEGHRMTVSGAVSTEADPGTVLATGEAALIELRPDKAMALLGSDLRLVGGRPVAASGPGELLPGPGHDHLG